MEEKLKSYADTLYDQSVLESAQILRDEKVTFLKEMAARRRSRDLPISGAELQVIMRFYVQHVERCMNARLESFQTAYSEAGMVPTEEELDFILKDIKGSQQLQIKHAASALENFMKTRGADGDPSETLTADSGREHDRILQKWKVWCGQVQLGRLAASGVRQSVSGRAALAATTRDVISAKADREFALLAIEEARKSDPEPDQRVHPRVGAVVARNGKVLAISHRGEFPGSHAEFIALEKKLADQLVAGATVYTTLEPCTVRNDPKIACAFRLAERKVSRVVIGILDPNPNVLGKGWQILRDAGIETQFFPHDLMTQIEDLNRDFIRDQKQKSKGEKVLSNTRCNRLSDPVVVLEYEWDESRSLGVGRTMRNRKFTLRNRGAADAVDVQIEDVMFSSGSARFELVSKILVGEEVAVAANIADKPILLSYEFEWLLMDEWNSKGNLAADLEAIPVSVRYKDYWGAVYVTRHLIEYNPFNGTSKTRFVACEKFD